MKERRRWPRGELKSEEVVRLELRHRVQLLDISRSGALLACDAQLPAGTRGHLRTELAAQPFTAEVSVKRLHPRPSPNGEPSFGTQFDSMDDRSRQHLELFLRRGLD